MTALYIHEWWIVDFQCMRGGEWYECKFTREYSNSMNHSASWQFPRYFTSYKNYNIMNVIISINTTFRIYSIPTWTIQSPMNQIVEFLKLKSGLSHKLDLMMGSCNDLTNSISAKRVISIEITDIWYISKNISDF